jgi:hypothetical protein
MKFVFLSIQRGITAVTTTVSQMVRQMKDWRRFIVSQRMTLLERYLPRVVHTVA